ncbi:MAG: trypsin-like peptidase domain-containing protein [Candidatus Acidiferrales bacterium]
MDTTPEKIVLVEGDARQREEMRSALQAAGYEVAEFGASREGLDAIQQNGADLLLMDARLQNPSASEMMATVRGAAKTEATRVVLLVGAGAEERAAAMDLGADDAISKPCESKELLARVRARLRVKRVEHELRDKVRIAEEGQQIAHTAFEALAVTEKMTNDAFSLDRKLKTGFAAVFAIAILMAGIYFLFARSAQKVTQRSNSILTKLEGGILRQQDLMAQARKLRAQQESTDATLAGKDDLKKQAEDLKQKMAKASPDDAASLQKELAETNARLERLEHEGEAAQSIIPADVKSVCLLHVAVAFNDQQTGRRLRYGGLNQDGEPIQDSDGNPVLTLDGNGPEVKVDVFGTGFLAGPDGTVITNRHVAEPWWKNDDLSSMTKQGLQPQISVIRAYFPGDPRAFHAEIQEISQETDLAAMRVDMQGLKRSVLSIETAKGAAMSGQPIILMGYATGLAAILARTDEESAQTILKKSGSDVSQVLDELAKRNLIRPLITQGHIGDILPDKIVFDAQTTSGGSGGPLFDREGKVIGVTYAVLKGFGGSNFGIPIRFSEPLLKH